MKRMIFAASAALFASLMLASSTALADGYDPNTHTYTVSTAEYLNTAVDAINTADSGSYTISLENDINAAGISFSKNTTTIIGNGHTLNFGDSVSGITVSGSGNPTVILGDEYNSDNKLTIKSTLGVNNKTSQEHFLSVGNKGSYGTLKMYDGVTVTGFRLDNHFGGAVYVYDDGKFYMYGGTITDCGISSGSVRFGGGVAVVGGGYFEMNGGTITGCFANSGNGYGGGVFVGEGSFFILNKGFIEYNIADVGGGVAIATAHTGNQGDLDSRFEMTGGSINHNTATNYGGGVAAWGNPISVSALATTPVIGNVNTPGIYLNGGHIDSNTATTYGGGIFLFRLDHSYTSRTNVKDMYISDNDATMGGGVCVYSFWTKLNMDGCFVTNNTAKWNGAGISLVANSGKTTSDTYISNTEITGNSINDPDNDVSDRGAGIFYDAKAELTISGLMNITGNTYTSASYTNAASNLNVLAANELVNVKKLTTGSQIGLSDPTLWEDNMIDADPEAVSSAKLTSGYAANNSGVNPSQYFTSDHDTWYADYSADETEVRLVRRTAPTIMVLPVTTDESKPGAYSDAGYYNVDENDTDNENALGVVRFSTYVENTDDVAINAIGTELKLGNNTKIIEKSIPNTTASFTFSVDVNAIPRSAWDTSITGKSYAKSGASTFYSINNPDMQIKVNDNLKWLGSGETYDDKIYTNTEPDADIVAGIKNQGGN